MGTTLLRNGQLNVGYSCAVYTNGQRWILKQQSNGGNNMWISMNDLKRAISAVINEPYINDAKKLREELEDLKLKKRIEEAEIKHLVKMKEEKNAIELEKQVNAMTKEFAEKEMALLKKYQQDLTGRFVEEQKNLQAVYAEIMKRLPNVNLEIERKSR